MPNLPTRATARLVVAGALLAALAACGERKEEALAPEPNPPGRIPADEVYVTYQSPDGGYSIEGPERWARTEGGGTVTFVNGPSGFGVAVQPAGEAPTVASVRAREVKGIESSARAAEILAVEEVTLPAGTAVVVKFRTNSDPDATGKRYRLDNRMVIFHAAGKIAGLTTWSPQGTDNEAHWDRAARSFRWTAETSPPPAQ